MVTLILSSISAHMVGAIWLILTLLLSFGPFQQLLDHLCNVDPIIRSRILGEVLPSTYIKVAMFSYPGLQKFS